MDVFKVPFMQLTRPDASRTKMAQPKEAVHASATQPIEAVSCDMIRSDFVPNLGTAAPQAYAVRACTANCCLFGCRRTYSGGHTEGHNGAQPDTRQSLSQWLVPTLQACCERWSGEFRLQ